MKNAHGAGDRNVSGAVFMPGSRYLIRGSLRGRPERLKYLFFRGSDLKNVT